MRKHILIITFLLCAFAAVGPLAVFPALAAVDTIRVTPYGIYPPGDKPFDKLADYFNPSGDTSVYRRDIPWSISVNDNTPGWEVAYWLSEGSQPVHGEFAGTKINDTEGKKTYVLTEDYFSKATSGVLFLAVKFAYTPFNVTFDKNGADGGAMDPLKDLNIDTPETQLPPCAFTRTGYDMAGWSNAVYWAAHTTAVADKGKIKGEDFWNDTAKGFDGELFALWTPHAYEITCDLNGGAWPSAKDDPPAEAFYDQIFLLSAPSRLGYDFLGWKVTTGLDSLTAKWGTDKDPTQTVEADMLCANGGKEVYFKNLNSTNGAAVTLTAQWQPKTITVTFNNTGGSSGGGLLDSLDMTYDAAYPALNPPSKGGNLFRGYEIGGVQYWNMNGQQTKSTWDIPSNCTAVARWEALAYHLTYYENRSDGTTSKEVVQDFEYGVPTKLYDGAEFSNLGCTLLGWSTNKNAEKPDEGCEIGGTKAFTDSKMLYAVWEKNYFIAYDGNGATNEVPMMVQKLVIGRPNQSLNPNTYGKVGYSFRGWATNRVAAQLLDWTYGDRQILKNDLAKVLGETNTLYATWETNTYYIAFDPNGGTGAAMPIRPYTYDQPVMLPEATYIRDIHDFVGWSNDVTKVIYADLSKPVSNLCASANGTNTLYAVWKSMLSDLAIAMGCDNLNWKGETNAWYASTVEWTDGSTISCVRADADGACMNSSAIITNGVLHFWWKATGERLSVQCLYPGGQSWSKRLDDGYPYDVWNETNIVVSLSDLKGDSTFLSFLHRKNGTCYIAKMTWTPEGANPEPTDADKVTISSAAVSDGKFTLSFEFNEDFDYLLKTNADLLIDSWGVMEIEGKKTDNILTFEPQIIEGQPQLFYKVETIQKK